MLKDHTAITQALLGTLLTWALTAAGAALVIIIRGKQVSIDRRTLVFSETIRSPAGSLRSKCRLRRIRSWSVGGNLTLPAHPLVRETLTSKRAFALFSTAHRTLFCD